MRKWLVGALAAFVLAPEAWAAEGFGDPKTVGDAFNAMAKAAKVEPRMVLRECFGEPHDRCKFSIGGNVSVAAFSDEKSPGSVKMIVFGADRSSDLKRYATSAVNAIATWSKSDDPYEIKAAFEILFKEPIKQDVRTVSMKGATFILKPINGAIFFSVRDHSLD